MDTEICTFDELLSELLYLHGKYEYFCYDLSCKCFYKNMCIELIFTFDDIKVTDKYLVDDYYKNIVIQQFDNHDNLCMSYILDAEDLFFLKEMVVTENFYKNYKKNIPVNYWTIILIIGKDFYSFKNFYGAELDADYQIEVTQEGENIKVSILDDDIDIRDNYNDDLYYYPVCDFQFGNNAFGFKNKTDNSFHYMETKNDLRLIDIINKYSDEEGYITSFVI